MIRTYEKAQQVQSRREKSGLVGCASAVKTWNNKASRGEKVNYKRGKTAPKQKAQENERTEEAA